MYMYIALIGWILGISFMGYYSPAYLNLLMWISLALSLVLCVCRCLNYSLINSVVFKLVSLSVVGISSGLLGFYYADSALEKRLSLRDTPPHQIEKIIYISNINSIKQTDSSSNTQLSKAQQRIQQKVLLLEPNKVRQMLMYLDGSQSEMIQLGQYYRVTGHIKPIHGYAVAGVFDKEKWFLQENILAVFKPQSVEHIDENQVKQLGYSPFVEQQNSVRYRIQLSIENLRLKFRDLIADSSLKNKGLVLALLTGDESLLANETQDLFKTMGISHLLAISGPHVLIFATLFCFLFNSIIKKVYPQIFLNIPQPYLLVYPFLACVVFYSAFVGFEIPALRTMLTVSILSVIILFKQKIQPLKHLLLTASILLLLDPFSILSSAFWLSFGSCFILIRVYQTVQQHALPTVETWKTKTKLFIRVLIDSQWKIFIALLPVVLWIFQQFSWITPLSNLLAIPMIGALIVPIEVLAACISMLFEPLGLWLFTISDLLLSMLLYLLERLDQLLNFKLNWWAFTSLEIVCIALAVFILFLPKGVLPKFWAILCLIPLVISHKSSAIFQLDIIDVGQGQAIFLNLPQHKMLIDTGGSFDEARFSIGKNVIIPYLMRQGIAQLDQVVLTHLDQDHSGAFAEIEKVIKMNKVYSNETDARFNLHDFDYCHQGQYWQYEDVRISVLAPDKNSLSKAAYDRNELSCVIYIQVPQSKSYQNFLLMGDAGWETEFNLLTQYPDLKVDVLVLGHHGSKNSSSYAFLKQLQPKLAIVSAGYANRYGHPHPIVLKRLDVLNIPVKTTIEQGSIQFKLNPQGQMEVTGYRQTLKWLTFRNRFIAD